MEKLKTVVVTILATLGVLFIIIMLMPDDEDEATEVANAEISAVSEIADNQQSPEEGSEIAEINGVAEVAEVSETPSDTEENAEDSLNQNGQVLGSSRDDDAVTVTIPESELSSSTLSFQTVSLDNQILSQDIFSGYDLTIVHVWGTYCQPCIREMGDYAKLYKNLPGNVNLVGIVCDVYDGIDNNVSSAKKILQDADADFVNLRMSDDVYNITADIQLFPSSFFVDSKGHIVGKLLEGESFEATQNRLNSYLGK